MQPSKPFAELKALVSSPYNAMIVTKIAKKADHWDSCKEELEKFYFEQSLQLPGIRYRDTSGDEKKREDFNKLMDGQRTKLLKNLASRQVKERYGEKGISLFNDIDKAEAAKNKAATSSKQKVERAVPNKGGPAK